MLFIVGDVRHGKVHGYYPLPNKKREHVTANVDECRKVGVSKVRHREPCSLKWLSDHK